MHHLLHHLQPQLQHLLQLFFRDAIKTGAAAPPVAAVAITPIAMAETPIVNLAQLGNDQLPVSSKRFAGLFLQYAKRL